MKSSILSFAIAASISGCASSGSGVTSAQGAKEGAQDSTAKPVATVRAHPRGKPGVKTLRRAEIPPGFAVGTATAEPLALDVAIDGGQASASAADPGSANVTARRGSGESQTMLTIEGKLQQAVKFDLYISPDGEQFHYTSSCALSPGISSFEMWPHAIHSFALGNPRVVDQNKMTCD